MATGYGVESTVRAAYDIGLSVVVPTDAVSDPDPDAHERTLKYTFPLLALTTLTESLLDLAQASS